MKQNEVPEVGKSIQINEHAGTMQKDSDWTVVNAKLHQGTLVIGIKD